MTAKVITKLDVFEGREIENPELAVPQRKRIKP